MRLYSAQTELLIMNYPLALAALRQLNKTTKCIGKIQTRIRSDKAQAAEV